MPLIYRHNAASQWQPPKAPIETEVLIETDSFDYRPRYLRRSPIFSATRGRAHEYRGQDRNFPTLPPEDIQMTAKKTKTAAAKPAKSSTGAAKPGIIATIVEMISRTEGASKDEILKILVKKFPDRDPDGMGKTIIIQANRNKSSKETIEDRGIVYYNRRRSAQAGA
jgi:hypothetical protein